MAGDSNNRQGSSVDSGLRPDARTVNEFHSNDDLDKDANSHHHSLGSGANQASPGSHNHDGSTSVQLLEGFTLSGTRGTATSIVSIIDALVQLGATDNTTA